LTCQVIEVQCPYGRVDVVTSNLVIEVEYLDKFKEAIGQAQWYSWHGGKAPCMALIVPSNEVARYTYVRDKVKANIPKMVVLGMSRETGAVFDGK